MKFTTSRRSFVVGGLALASTEIFRVARIEAESDEFEPWRAGFLDIHHVSTGRGNSTLLICPDGKSIMIDAGAVKSASEGMDAARPNGSRRPGEWIGRYALHHMRTAPRQELDYFVLTHFHGDHMGDLFPDSPRSRYGDYRLTGVTDVAELIPIHCLIDRGFPAYDYPAPANYDATLNYIQFAHWLEKRGFTVQKLVVGSSRQIVSATPNMLVRNLAANGEVWTGHRDEKRAVFPPIATLKPESLPPENTCSIALRVNYGAFTYYTGGDLTSDTNFGTTTWQDIETAVAQVAGPVNVATLDHHGYFDATGPEFVRLMRPRVVIVQTWHASHPALSVLNAVYSKTLYSGDRDVFATGLVPAAGLADARFSDRMLSQHGHVVVRVPPGGAQYEVIVLDDSVEDGKVKARFGPYRSA
jgi:beta-lactamase superfamily II metal-dependent hydrolase